MNKKAVSIIIFISLFCLTSFVLAQTTLPNPLGATDTIPKLLKLIITAIGTLVASLGTIMLIVAGILYLTSAGNPEKINTAKKALIYAIVGIAIGVAAGVIATVICNIIGVTGTTC